MRLNGIPVYESNLLPFDPSAGEVGRRIVRHGLADVLAWLGEEVGPKPADQTHILMFGGVLHASTAVVGKLKESK